jgi:hypothetical protein
MTGQRNGLLDWPMMYRVKSLSSYFTVTPCLVFSTVKVAACVTTVTAISMDKMEKHLVLIVYSLQAY